MTAVLAVVASLASGAAVLLFAVQQQRAEQVTLNSETLNTEPILQDVAIPPLLLFIVVLIVLAAAGVATVPSVTVCCPAWFMANALNQFGSDSSDTDPEPERKGCVMRYLDRLKANWAFMQYIVMFAIVAETFSHCWLSIAGTQASIWDICHGPVGLSDGRQYATHPNDLAEAYTIIFCNLVGTFVAGAAMVLSFELKPTAASDADRLPGAGLEAWQLAAAIKDGFSPCLTTFPGAVEVSISLLHHKSALFAWLNLIGGPVLLGTGAKLAQGVLLVGCRNGLYGKVCPAHYKTAVIMFLMVSIYNEILFKRSITQLLVGWIMAVLAVLISNAISTVVPGELAWRINWATVFANLLAMIIVSTCRSAHEFLEATRLRGTSIHQVIVGKFLTTFCGTISAYSIFAEDVVRPLLLQFCAGWRAAVPNWIMNVLVGVFFFGLFDASYMQGDVNQALKANQTKVAVVSARQVHCI